MGKKDKDRSSARYPAIGKTGFGWIEVDGERWEKDVLITHSSNFKRVKSH